MFLALVGTGVGYFHGLSFRAEAKAIVQCLVCISTGHADFRIAAIQGGVVAATHAILHQTADRAVGAWRSLRNLRTSTIDAPQSNFALREWKGGIAR